MLQSFQKDLKEAKAAEAIVLHALNSLTTGFTFEDVSNDRQCFYKGDIRAIAADGRELYIEVKDDKRIAETGRVLCEEENYIKCSDYWIKGGMYNNTDIYAVVSQQERKIYFFDFKQLQKIYKKGEYKVIQHAQQDSYCYLLELCRIKQWGAFMGVLKY